MKFKKNDKVRYNEPESILKQYYDLVNGQVYTIQKIKNNRLFLKEILDYFPFDESSYDPKYFSLSKKYMTKLGKILYK